MIFGMHYLQLIYCGKNTETLYDYWLGYFLISESPCVSSDKVKDNEP